MKLATRLMLPVIIGVLCACDTTESSTDPDTTAATDTGCPAQETECDGTCTHTSTNPLHCGACGVTCASGEVCSLGACSSECASDLTTCGSACVDTQTNVRHCGACDSTCDSDQTCTNGACVTAPPTCSQTLCGADCVDPQSDERHCGACNTACTTAQTCTGGTCVDNTPVDPPTSTCTAPISLEDTSTPDTVVGDGTSASCTHEALAAAVAQGGVITFDCGAEPVTLDITEALQLRTDVDTIIDGGGLVTLDGGRNDGRQNRIFEYHSPDYRVTTTRVVVQRLTLQNAEAPTSDYTPPNPDNAQCAWGYKDGEGGAVRMRDGRLHVIDCVFRNNHAAPTGPDTGGGAIYAAGALEVIVVGSTFVDNQGSNSGAIGLLQTDGLFFNSHFEGNRATGEGQNFGGASGCPEFNHAAQGGAGGNGGAMAIDGNDVERVEFCGVVFKDNHANELATIFRTPNSQRGLTTFDHCLFEGNHASDGGGAIWMQDMTFEMRNSAVIGNTSDGLGGGIRIDQGPHGSTLLLENVTLAGNVATNSLGGGLVFAGEGTIRNCTFAENEAAGGEGYFGAAIVSHGEASANLEVHNTIFWNNIDDHEWTPMTCSILNPGTPGTLPGSNNVQWPEMRNGTNNQMDNPCTPNITFADPQLSPLADNGGPTPTMMPAANSVVIGLGGDCPTTDQRGEPRPATGCAAGAVEP